MEHTEKTDKSCGSAAMPCYTPITVTCFKTSDGSKFESIASANYHQMEIEKADRADKVLKNGGSIADSLRAAGSKVEIDPILEKVTKLSKLSIKHWQCKDEPGYSPMWFEQGMRLMVGGNVGSWSGPYRNYVSIDDLIRYAKDPKSKLSV